MPPASSVDTLALLRFVISYRQSVGYSPSLREIAEVFGIAPSTTARLLRKLAEDKLLTVTPVPRGYVPTALGIARAS